MTLRCSPVFQFRPGLVLNIWEGRNTRGVSGGPRELQREEIAEELMIMIASIGEALSMC